MTFPLLNESIMSKPQIAEVFKNVRIYPATPCFTGILEFTPRQFSAMIHAHEHYPEHYFLYLHYSALTGRMKSRSLEKV